MKILTIHCGNSGFFARFYNALSIDLEKKGHESFFVGPSNSANKRNKLNNQYLVGSKWNWFFHYSIYKIFGVQDIFSLITTLQTCSYIKRVSPDIIHFHIIQEWFLNIPMLIWYIKRSNIKVVWTMHDCRAFTGRCAYFDEINCNKWKSKCYKCPQKTLYSPSYIDNTKLTYLIRKETFKTLPLDIVCPSQWLADLVKQSFFKSKRIHVIHNGINSDDFSFQESNFKTAFNIENKFLLLGVASIWENRKGLDTFIRLAQDLPNEFVIVLVGSLAKSDSLPRNIIHVNKTSSTKELAKIYSAADLFINPTIADNYPTTNMECQACGTPVITYNTGGCGESISENTGIIIEKGNYEKLLHSILDVYQQKRFNKSVIQKESQKFSIHEMTTQYIRLYEQISK